MAQRLHESFQKDEYHLQKKLFKFLGGAFYVRDKSENLVFYSEQKALKLKEEINVFAEESMATKMLSINTEQILDVGATYTIQDATNDQNVGSLKREGLKSLFKDEWTFFSEHGEEIAKLTEKSVLRAFVSRFISFFPQSYVIRDDTGVIAIIEQKFHPFLLKYTLKFKKPHPQVDRRLIIAMAIMLCAIEGRQD